MTALARYYAAEMRMAVMSTFQYRVATYFLLIGFLVEPVVYLVVWRTVAEAQGGSVGTYTADAFTAYYIVWTLVRAMNVALTPYVWDGRIQRGRLSDLLLRPIHPFHRDLAFFSGMKIVWILFWIPIAVVLAAAFRPELSPTIFQWAGFLVAIWLGYVVRFIVLYLLGMLSFWTTRASAVFETIVAAELIFSGRLVPLSLMPSWVEDLGGMLPFKWTFQFPIELLIGRLSNEAILTGLGMQVVWIAALGAALAVTWRFAVKRYTAVGS